MTSRKKSGRQNVSLFITFFLSSCLTSLTMSAYAQVQERIDASSAGVFAAGGSWNPSISKDGVHVAFYSWASNLVDDDTNSIADIFVRNRTTGVTVRANVATDGTQADDISENPSLSGDGRFVAFQSKATVATQLAKDVAFVEDSYHVYLRDLGNNQTILVSKNLPGREIGAGYSYRPRVSFDGRYVVFDSWVVHQFEGDPYYKYDVFLYDRQTDSLILVSRNVSGTQGNGSDQGPDITGDGRYVVFESQSTNIVSNTLDGTTSHLIRRDLQTGENLLVSVNSEGTPADKSCTEPRISDDGRYVTFRSYATNLVSGTANGKQHLFIKDLVTNEVRRITQNSSGDPGDLNSFDAAISPDGRFVAFQSAAGNLTDQSEYGVGHEYLYDLEKNELRLLDINAAGAVGNNDVFTANDISEGGRYVVFDSEATNLVANDPVDYNDGIYLALGSVSEDWSIGPKGTIGGWRNDVAISGNIVAVAEGKGVSLYEISGETLVKKSTLSLSIEPTAIAISGTKLYGASGPWEDAPLFFVADITNLSSPSVLGSCTASCPNHGSLIAAGDYVYMSALSGDSWVVNAIAAVDVSNPSAPVAQGNLALGDGVIANAFTIDGDRLYLQGSLNGAPMFFVYALSSPLAPAKTGELAAGVSETSQGLHASGDLVYSAIGSKGVRVVDVSSPENPLPRHQFTIVEGTTALTVGDVYATGNTLYVAAGNGGTVVFNVTDPMNPIRLGAVPMKGTFRVTGSTGGVVAMAGEGDIAVQKIGMAGATPVSQGGAASPMVPSAPLAVGNRLYLGGDGLFIYDITDPALPALLSVNAAWRYFTPLAATDNTLVGLSAAPDFWTKTILSVIDVSNPENPVARGSYTTGDGNFVAGAVAGNIAYLARNKPDAEIVDFSDPANPLKIGMLPFSSTSGSLDIAAAGNIACIAGQTENGYRVHIFDVTTPASPVLKSELTPPGGTIRLWLAGSTLLVSSNTGTGNSVEAFDLTDPANPEKAGAITVPLDAEDIAALLQEGQEPIVLLAKPGGSVHTYGYSPSSGVFYAGPVCHSPYSHQVMVSQTPNRTGGYTVATSDESYGLYTQEITRTPSTCCLTTEVSPAQAAAEGCTAAPAKVDPVDCGGTVDVTATAKEPWYFKEWTGAATGASPSATATATGRCSVAVANFVKPTLTLTAGVQNPGAYAEFYGITGEYAYANGRTNVPVIHVVLTANDVDDWLATAMTFMTSGTGNEKEDVAEARLYLGNIGGTLLGTKTFTDDNGNLSFNFTVNIPKSSSVSMILVYDFKPERAFPCNNYSAKLDMAHVTAIPVNYPPGQKLPVPPLGVTGGPSTIKRGDVVIDDGDRQYGQPEDQQHPNPPPLEKKLKTRLKWQPPATVEYIQYEISSALAWGGFLEGVRGQRKVEQPVNAEGYAEASMTLGTAKGHDNPYAVVVDQKNRGAACYSSYARSVFTEWGMGVELPTNARYDGTADGGEDGFGTFLNMIQLENDFIVTVTMAPENFAEIKEVNFQLGSLLHAQGTSLGNNQYKATFDLKHFNGPTPLTITCVLNRNGEQITAEERYMVKIIPLPSWVNAVGEICDGSSFVKEFVGEDEAYKLTFNYPTNFAWSDYVPGDVGMLGGLNNKLDIEFSAEALYRIDETSTFGATVKGKPTILGKEFDLEGGLSGDFDPNFAFQRGTGNLRASFGFDLPEKGYSKTFLVYGVPITAAVDLSGNVEIFVRGAAVLNRQLEFEEITVAPGTTVTGNITISLSAVFGLAKISATGSPSVTLEIEMKYTSANGTNTTWRGEVVVPITVVGSIFWGVGSAELCSVTLGPWTFGSGAAPQAFRSPMGAGAAAPRFLSSQSLAVDATGRRMLVWTDDAAPDQPSPNAELYYRFHNGTDWGEKGPITGSTTPNAEWETDPAAVFLGSGTALACWTANKGAPTLNNLNEILAAQDIACSAWSGTAWSAAQKIIDDDQADGTATIAYDAVNNRAVAVWVHNADAQKDAMKRTSWNLKYALFDPSIPGWTQAADVPGTESGADMMPAVSVDASGNPVLVWARDDDGIYFTENEKGANDEPVVKNGTTIASADNLDSRILWSKWSGSSWSAPAAVASGDKATRLAPSIAPSPGGQALAVWTEKEPGKKNSIKYAVFDTSAGLWTTPGLVVESSQFLEEPEAVVDATGKVTVIWKGYTKGGGALFSSTGQMAAAIVWSEPKQITANDAIQWQLVAVVDKDNRILTSWSEYDAVTGKPVTSGGFGSAGNVVDPNPGSATLAGTYSDRAVDANSDGLYEAVEVSVDATIVLAGNYEVRGKLFKDGKFLVRAVSVRDGLSVGKQTFALLFPGAVLGDRGAGGPYQLRDVVLIDRNGTAIRIDGAGTPYATTGMYDPAKFAPGPLKLDKTRYIGTGARAVVTLTDPSRNTNSETIQTAAVRVASALDPTGFLLTLTETGVATGVFTGEVGFSLTASNADQKRIHVGDHALLQVIHDDSVLDYRWVAAAPWVIGGSGDLNGDGLLDMADAVLAMQVMTKKINAGTVVMKAAGVGGREEIGSDDALYILQKNAGLR
ncbi:MAG: hypothetical protein M0P74_02225 [Syntrophales bacterium]|jgi:hypothetical protein|nr:hypothetical protein [Syntrophales bacterium]